MRFFALIALLVAMVLVMYILAHRPKTTTCYYVINLHHRADRMRHMRAQLRDAQITDVRRVEAVQGDQLKLAFLRRILSPSAYEDVMRARGPSGFRTDHAQLTPGAVGCYLSHIDTWKRVVRDLPREDDYACIFEDDINLPRDFVARADAFMRHVPTDWDLVLFGYLSTDPDSHATNVKYRPLPSFLCTHAYAIRKRTARALLARHDLFPMTQQIDWYLSALGLRVYGPPQPFVFQQNHIFGTDIQKPVTETEACGQS